MRRLILDADLLVLLVVGRVDPGLIASHKRLRSYEERDYGLLIKTVGEYGQLLLTPNVATEASNLLRHSSEPAKALFAAVLAEVIAEAEERYVPSRTTVEDPSYAILGVTDAALLALASKDDVLLTADFQLYRLTDMGGRSVLNFRHLQAEAYGY